MFTPRTKHPHRSASSISTKACYVFIPVCEARHYSHGPRCFSAFLILWFSSSPTPLTLRDSRSGKRGSSLWTTNFFILQFDEIIKFKILRQYLLLRLLVMSLFSLSGMASPIVFRPKSTETDIGEMGFAFESSTPSALETKLELEVDEPHERSPFQAAAFPSLRVKTRLDNRVLRKRENEVGAPTTGVTGQSPDDDTSGQSPNISSTYGNGGSEDSLQSVGATQGAISVESHGSSFLLAPTCGPGNLHTVTPTTTDVPSPSHSHASQFEASTAEDVRIAANFKGSFELILSPALNNAALSPTAETAPSSPTTVGFSAKWPITNEAINQHLACAYEPDNDLMTMRVVAGLIAALLLLYLINVS
ncbi:hypothetical protein D9757_003039 [Collybiopsis confluens]|uniref:Uncharacterized protein n=1 Tax=Collybiopsis confluens TaxID=2823264 RepID=A0A8H5ME96_9AGAR|nr:hypothetical protein D9757_003039 [Collybiopsis confluens]